MDLYTLSPTFLPDVNIDEFVSAIWTERYSSAGDFQLVVPGTKDNVNLLAPGTFLALRGTKEVMICETQSIEDGLLTVVGSDLLAFLNQRLAWFKNPAYDGTDTTVSKIVDYTDATKTVGAFIADVVNQMVIAPANFTGLWASATLDTPNEDIAGLVLGPVDNTGVAERLTIPTGPLYDAIAQLATQKALGISLYLDSADPVTGFVLKFTTYRGKDRTSGQVVNPLVRLTPDLDSLTGLKEVNSNAEFKNIAYVWYQNTVSKHLADPLSPEPTGFNRRVLVTDAQGEPVGHKEQFGRGGMLGWTQYVVGPADLAAFRAQNAADALANHNYIHAVDGQTSPISQFIYGTDYNLGDILELQGVTGSLSKARVTEFIRSQDKSGERNYPTISVVA